MRNIEKYLEPALVYLEAERAKPAADRKFFQKTGATPKIEKQYKGYVAAFGTTIMQSGLLAATVIYSDESGQSEKSKKPVVDAILHLLRNTMSTTSEMTGATSLLTLVKNNTALRPRLRREIMHATVALKLAIRTFPIEK